MNHFALITGSYGGLGACFVTIHAKKGGDLILAGRDQAKLDAQAKEVSEKFHVTAYTIAVDLSRADAAQIIYNRCKDIGILPDIIINNAVLYFIINCYIAYNMRLSFCNIFKA